MTLCIGLFVTTAWASQEPRREQILAATADATRALQQEVSQTSIAPDLTVDALLEKTRGHDALLKALERAEQIGGPRWVDEQTCQIQLEIAGAKVVDALLAIVAANPDASPLPQPLIEQRLEEWKTRAFTATGVSTAASRVCEVRPQASNGVWSSVPDTQRRDALSKAKEDAITRVIDSVKPLELSTGKTVADVLSDPDRAEALQKWLAARPVTTVEFNDDLEVKVTLDIRAKDLLEALRGDSPAEEADASLVETFQQKMASPIGGARAAVTMDRPPPAVALPSEMPAWAGQSIEAEGAADAGESKLQVARSAEANALDKLRSRIDSLPLTADLTLAAAARRDARIGAAIQRAVRNARVSKTDYHDDGAVVVKVMLDLRDLWKELQSLRGAV